MDAREVAVGERRAQPAQHASRPIPTRGPVLEAEALSVHQTFHGVATAAAAAGAANGQSPKKHKSKGGAAGSAAAAAQSDAMDIDVSPAAVIRGENWTVRTFNTGPMKIEATINLH